MYIRNQDVPQHSYQHQHLDLFSLAKLSRQKAQKHAACRWQYGPDKVSLQSASGGIRATAWRNPPCILVATSEKLVTLFWSALVFSPCSTPSVQLILVPATSRGHMQFLAPKKPPQNSHSEWHFVPKNKALKSLPPRRFHFEVRRDLEVEVLRATKKKARVRKFSKSLDPSQVFWMKRG